MLRIVCLAFFMAVMLANPASAKTWVIDYDKSYLGFVAQQSEQSVKGRFGKFTATVDFDPADPQKGKITGTIDIASVLADSVEVRTNLPTSDFFDTAKFPKASFSTNFIDATHEANCYEASSELTLKSITKEITMNFCLTPEGDGMRAKGEATVMRNDFGVGLGQWADEAMISNPVKVIFDIVAK